MYNCKNNNFIFVTAFLCIGVLMFFAEPLTPFLLDIVSPINKTRPKKLPFYNVEYFIDEQKYYVELFILNFILFIFNILVTITFDTTIFNFVKHVCSLFIIIE